MTGATVYDCRSGREVLNDKMAARSSFVTDETEQCRP
jgi:hypothetical protein